MSASKDERTKEKKEIVPICPTRFADMETVVKKLKRKEGVIVDFDDVPPAVAQRMLDFLSGAVFSLRGSIRKLKYKTYALIPDGATITTITR